MSVIVTENLSKTYRTGLTRKAGVTALTGLSMSVEPGQIFSLLGPNGAGKTTFIKILLGLTHPTSGSAHVLGSPVQSSRMRALVGYLPENHRYPAYLTGEHVLRLFGKLSGVTGPLLGQRISSLLDLVGMAQWRTTKVRRFSKGMLQRLGLAQALMNDPTVLFLDEPTDGVDPVGRREIRDVLKNLRDQGKTVFLNSHLLSEVELVSDRVAILNKGQLLKVGSVDELTVTGDQYRIGFEGGIPEDVLTELAATITPTRLEGSVLTVDVGDIQALNAIIDRLRSRSVLLTSVTQVRSTLEDSFLKLLKKETGS
jgi:ABC-2 type transport system ATP-binding protein